MSCFVPSCSRHRALSVVITCSVVPSHPETFLLDATVNSLRHRVKSITHNTHIVVVCDVVDEIVENSNDVSFKKARVTREQRNNYHAFIKSVQAKIHNREEPYHTANVKCVDLRFAETPSHGAKSDASTPLTVPARRFGFGHAVGHALEHYVRTPLVLVIQHDYVFAREVNLDGVCAALLSPRYPSVQSVVLQSMATMNYATKISERFDLDIEPYVLPLPSTLEQMCALNGVPSCLSSLAAAADTARRGDATISKPRLTPTLMLYDKNHVARVDFWEKYVLPFVDRPAFPEDTIGASQLIDLKTNGMTRHATYGTYLLDEDDSEPCVYHLSGRKAALSPSSIRDAGENVVCNVSMGQGHGGNAQSHTAVVSGLEAPASQSTGKRFRQKCFRCGEKGHSFRFCPNSPVN